MPCRLSMKSGPRLDVLVGNLQRTCQRFHYKKMKEVLTVSGLQSVGQNTEVLSAESFGRSRESTKGLVCAIRIISLIAIMHSAMSLLSPT